MLTPPLTDIEYIKKLLAKTGNSPKRSLGQNFLISQEVLDATIAVTEAGPKNITELGAGIGTLTQALLAHKYAVRAIEKDDSLIQILKQRTAKNAELVHGDIKDSKWEWNQPYQVVGNIPYNLTGLIIRRLTKLHPAPTQAIFLMQKEVGDRLMAVPPEMSLLSLSIQLWGRAEHVLTVPQSCFWPQPKVTSSLILLTPSKAPVEEREEILQFAKICFREKRKQIVGTLKRSKKYKEEKIRAALATISAPDTTRPQELSSTQWHMLWSALERN